MSQARGFVQIGPAAKEGGSAILRPEKIRRIFLSRDFSPKIPDHAPRLPRGLFFSATTTHILPMKQNPPDLADFETMARAAIDALPPAFRGAARTVALRVTDWPERWMLEELEMTDPLTLTGLYDGIPMTVKSVTDQPHGPDTVWLFREPILAEWRDREDVALEDLVAHVTVHEFAHHFGWSDADIATIDRWWE